MKDNKLWTIFSQFIRLRNSDKDGYVKCFTCSRTLYWKDGDCGHGIPRQHQATKYNEINNQFQCKKCNGPEGGQQAIYKEEVEKKYGKGTWDKILIASRQLCKRNKSDIEIMIAYYQKEVIRLKTEKGIPLK